MIEFALVSPLLLALLLGTLQFGYSFYTYNNLQKAVRDGARYAASHEYPSKTFTNDVTNVVVCGNAAGPCAHPVVSGLNSGQVGVSVTPASGVPSVVTVKIKTYPLPGTFGSVTLINKPSCSFRFIGRYSPG
jgi:Flp pilus assembly protein TadG